MFHLQQKCFLKLLDLSPEEITDSSMVALGVRALDVRGEKQMYIRGLLDKYGSRAKFTDLPEILNHYYKNDDFENPEYYTTEDYRNAGVKVLDYKNPLSVRLHKNLELSGIAVADGQLHVQVHYLENAHRSWPTALHSISIGYISHYHLNSVL